MTKTLTEADLKQFTGSETWYRHALNQRVRDRDDPRPLHKWEIDRGKETKIDSKAITRELMELRHTADNGKAFRHAIEERGIYVSFAASSAKPRRRLGDPASAHMRAQAIKPLP